MKTLEFVKKHIGTLEHFLEQGGYPIREKESDSLELTSAIPALEFKDGLLSLNKKKKFPDKILAEFWKFKYKEARDESNKLYNAISEAYNKANN